MMKRLTRASIGILLAIGALLAVRHAYILFTVNLGPHSTLPKPKPLLSNPKNYPDAVPVPESKSFPNSLAPRSVPPMRVTQKSIESPPPPSIPPSTSSDSWSAPLREKNPSDCHKKFSALGYSESFEPFKPDLQAKTASSVSCIMNPGSRSTICDARNIMVDPKEIIVAKGGEAMESVLGRREEDEFPIYRKGAFVAFQSFAGDQGGDRLPHYTKDVIGAFAVSDAAPSCEDWIEDPTLFITRYEYANLYHTATDWYNMWVTLDWAGLLQARNDTRTLDGKQLTRPLPHRVMWLDGHAVGSLDSVWDTLFSPQIIRIGSLKRRTCFRRALFVPAGYSSPTYDWPDSCETQPAVREFALFVLGQHGLAHTAMIPSQATFLFREAYVAHPRNPGGSASRHVANRKELEAVLDRIGGKSMNPVGMSFHDQLQMVRQSRLLVGVHGAGLTHVLFMADGAKVLELQPPTHPLQHFQKLARWTGVQYLVTPYDLSLVPVGAEDYRVPEKPFETFVSSQVEAPR